MQSGIVIIMIGMVGAVLYGLMLAATLVALRRSRADLPTEFEDPNK